MNSGAQQSYRLCAAIFETVGPRKFFVFFCFSFHASSYDILVFNSLLLKRSSRNKEGRCLQRAVEKSKTTNFPCLARLPRFFFFFRKAIVTRKSIEKNAKATLSLTINCLYVARTHELIMYRCILTGKAYYRTVSYGTYCVKSTVWYLISRARQKMLR